VKATSRRVRRRNKQQDGVGEVEVGGGDELAWEEVRVGNEQVGEVEVGGGDKPAQDEVTIRRVRRRRMSMGVSLLSLSSPFTTTVPPYLLILVTFINVQIGAGVS